MDNMKYIMLNYGGLEIPILFPSIFQHFEVANGRKVISAGQVQLQGATKPLPDACVMVNAVKVCTFGESTTLKVKSRPEDAAIIEREINRWME